LTIGIANCILTVCILVMACIVTVCIVMVAYISNINVVEVIWHALCWCCVFILSRVWKLDESLASRQVNG